MTPHDIRTAVLTGDIRSDDVSIDEQKEFYVNVRELVISQQECYFVTKSGSRMSLNVHNLQNIGANLQNGGILMIAIPGTHIKTTSSAI